MVGADVVTSTRGGERASAMWLPGTASCTLSTGAHTVVLGLALLRCFMDVTYLVAMQLYVSFFGLAAVAALGNRCSDASLEDTAASTGVVPGSASGSPNTIPGACTSNVSLEETVDTTVSQKVVPGLPCGASKGKPVKAKRYTVIAIVAITVAVHKHALLFPYVFTVSEFTYLVAMQLYVSFFGLAVVAALGNRCSDASLEDTAASTGVVPGSASGSPNTIPGACTSNVSLEETVDTTVSQKVMPGLSCGASKAKLVKAKRYTVMVSVAITVAVYTHALVFPYVSTASELHKALQENARRNFNSCDSRFHDADVAGWAFLVRAGVRSQELCANETWGGQALPATSGGRGCFLCMSELLSMQSMAAASIS